MKVDSKIEINDFQLNNSKEFFKEVQELMVKHGIYSCKLFFHPLSKSKTSGTISTMIVKGYLEMSFEDPRICSEYWEKNPFSRGLVVEDSKCLGELIEIDLEGEEK